MTTQHPRRSRRLIVAIVSYFGLVYGTGFALGVVRTLWIAPWLGERWAELLEMPVMFCAIVIAAMLVGRRFIQKRDSSGAAIIGFGSLALLLAAEVLGIWYLRGERLGEFITSRDPLAGSIFLAMLFVFAIMPAVVVRMRGVARPQGEQPPRPK